MKPFRSQPDRTNRTVNKPFFSYADAFFTFLSGIVWHFFLVWPGLSWTTYWMLLGLLVVAIVGTKLIWRIITR